MERIAVPARKTASPFFVFFFDCGETFQDALLFFRVDSGEKRGIRNFFFVDHSFPFFHLTRAAICTFLFPSSITCGLPFSVLNVPHFGFSLELQHTFCHHCSILTIQKSIRDTYKICHDPLFPDSWQQIHRNRNC